MRTQFIVGMSLLLVASTTNADLRRSAPELELIKSFIMKKDYPEVIKDQTYHMKIEDAVAAPVLNDGSRDVVLLVTPNYRQSATVLIYEIGNENAVSRVTEGLAPGPLVPVTDKYLDSHTTGDAVDVVAPDEKQHPGAREKFIKAGIENFGGFVAYRNFFHGDGREGSPWFIDMSGVDSPLEGDNCSKFEFSTVDAIAAGQLDGSGKQTYLVAKVGEQLYIYLISGLRDGKFLNKKLWTVPVPADFKSFATGDPATVTYVAQDGQLKSLAAPK